MENLAAFWQFIEAFLSKLLFTCAVQLFLKEIFFRNLLLITIFGNLSKFTFGRNLLPFYYAFGTLSKSFSMFPQEKLCIFFSEKRNSLTFWTSRVKGLALCWKFCAKLSTLLYLFPVEHSAEWLSLEKVFFHHFLQLKQKYFKICEFFSAKFSKVFFFASEGTF